MLRHARFTAAVTGATVAVAALLAPTPAVAQVVEQRGLPSVASGERPGPDALYLPPPSDVPQLENTGPWEAEPILVSGASAYRDGEWLYQDYLFDDHGATGVLGRNDQYGPATNLYSPTGGTFIYPTDPVYAHNAADIVELRVKPLPDATAIRLTLNTLIDAERTGATVAIGDAVASAAWPHGAGVSSPAELFLTWHGDEVELVDAATGATVTPAPTASVDLERRQVDLRIPHAAWDPGNTTVRMTAGVGLWDVDAGTYLKPQPGSSTETTPGGGDVRGTAIVNVAPRYDEPTPTMAGATMADTAAGAKVLAAWWRDRDQSLALSQGDVSDFAAEIDFAKLVAEEDDESLVPTTGPLNRIVASRYVFGQGLDPDNICFGISAGIDLGTDCIGRYVGQLQPYAVYVPDRPAPEDGFGLTLLMHSLSANYNQYLGTQNQVQMGERGDGHIVVTPEARGPDGFYKGIPEAHTFEVWADVARHYPIDADNVAPTGYSMGGFGTYRLMARYPDLFSRGFSVVARPGSVIDQLASLRNHELLVWNATADELVNVATAEEAHAALVEAGIAHDYWQFPTADHLTLAGNDEYGPGADFLGEVDVDRDPATVTYVRDPREDSRDVVADHAYWVSDIQLRDTEAAPTGTVEVRSGGLGAVPTEATDTGPGGGVLTGGQNQAMPYVSRGVEPSEDGTGPVTDTLTVTATNVAAITVDPTRAGVSCDAEITVESDGPLDVTLAGCDTTTTDTTPAGSDAPTPAPDGALPATGGGLAGLGAVLTLAAGRLRRTRSGT